MNFNIKEMETLERSCKEERAAVLPPHVEDAADWQNLARSCSGGAAVAFRPPLATHIRAS